MTSSTSSPSRLRSAAAGVRGFAPWRKVLLESGLALLTAIVSLGLALLALRITWADLGARWAAGGQDQVLHYEIFGSALDAFPFLPNDRLGFPDAQNLFFAPLFDLWSALFVQVISPIVPDGVWAYNLYNLAGFAAVGLTAYFFFRALKVRAATSVVFGVLLAVAPFHFAQMMGHPFIANYWAVPLIGILVLIVAGPATDPFGSWVASGKTRAMQLSRRIIPIVVLTAALAFTQSYYFVFGAAVIGTTWFVVSLVSVVSGRGWRPLLWPTSLVALLLFFIGAQLIWLSLSWGERYEKYFKGRLPGESELYGGRITDLLLPSQNSGLPLFGRWAHEYAADTLILRTSEPASSSFIAVVAILLTSVVLFMRVAWMPRATDLAKQKPLAAFVLDSRVGTLVLAFSIAFLFFITTGLGAVLSYLVSPEIRAWSRMSIVLALFALGVLAVAIEMLVKRRVVLVIALVALSAIGFVDQIFGPMRYLSNAAIDDSDIRDFTTSVEDLLDDNCGVVQLPLKGFPETGAIGEMGDYDQALPYVLSGDNSLRWSYGAVKGTYGADFWQGITTPSAFADAVADSGACAILIDEKAYTETPDAWHRLVSGVVDPLQPDLVGTGEASRYALFVVP